MNYEDEEFEDEIDEEEKEYRQQMWEQAENSVDELYNALCAIDAPDSFLEDLDRIERWLNT